MAVCNTFFMKEHSKLITYQSGDNRFKYDWLPNSQENISLSSEVCESDFK